MRSSKIPVDGIVLAAGRSVRMGQPKLLVEIGGRPIIRHVIDNARNSRLRDLIVVTGPDYGDIMNAFNSPPEITGLRHCVNPNPGAGMAGSLRIGMAALDRSCRGALIVLGDQPFVTSDFIDRMLDAHMTDPSRIVVPTVRGRRSTPVLFPANLFSEVMSVRGDVGGRGVVQAHADRLLELETDSDRHHMDIDTPEDLAAAVRFMEQGGRA